MRDTPCGLVLFLHLEKTGGSTMVKMFEELEKRNELLFFNQACGWPQFASQLMERFRSELGLPYGSNGRRRLDRLMRPDSWMALPPGGKCSSGPHIQRGPHFEPMPSAAPPAFHQPSTSCLVVRARLSSSAFYISTSGRSVRVAPLEMRAAPARLAK